MKRINALIAPIAVFLMVNCGGSNTSHLSAPSPAVSLSYTNPNAVARDWKLVKDATSTGTHLVLNLVGPSDGTKYRGVGFTLQVDPTLVKTAQFRDPSGKALGYLVDGGIFLDKDATGKDVAPTLQAGGVRDGKLMVGIFQKTDDGVWPSGQGATAKDCSGIVLQVAIDFDATLSAFPGNAPLTVIKARVIPEKVDTLLTRKMEDISLKVGSLALR